MASIPRPVTQKRPNAAISREVARVLRGKGVHTPFSITQAISVDLDGDGKTEDVVKAERLVYMNGSITPTVRAGDYSMVAVFRDGKLLKTLGANFFPRAKQFEAPQTFAVTSSTASGLKQVLAADCGV